MHKKQVILLMITNSKKQHYLAVTDISALFQKISSNHDGDFYCLNCFSSYTTKNKLKEHEEICNNNDSCCIGMPSWTEKTLKYNPGEKSFKAPYTIYIDLERIFKKVQSSQNNPEKSYAEKKARHETSGWSMSIISSFDKKENEISYYRGKDCFENLCKKIKESASEIINSEKKRNYTICPRRN